MEKLSVLKNLLSRGRKLWWIGLLVCFSFMIMTVSGCSMSPESLNPTIQTSDALSVNTVISGQWDIVWIGGKNYCVQNDIWNGSSGAQVLNVNDGNGDFTVQSSYANVSTSGPPMSYPSIFKGNHYNTITSGSGMPIQVSAIGSLNSAWTIVTAGGSWDAAYDIWFQNGTYNGGNYNGAELMIWLNHSGPPQPIGSKIGTAYLEGTTWDVWYGNIGWNVISFVRTSGTTSVNFNIKPFISDCVSRGYINNSWNLMAVEAGFEIWQGGAGLQSKGFSVTVNGDGGGSSSSSSDGGSGGNLSGTIKLQAVVNGKYICADNAGSSPLLANRGTASTWEAYDVINNGDNTYSFRARANGKFVCADNAGSSPLIANRTAVGDWEKFYATQYSDGSYSFKAKANGKYVCADNAGTSPLIANRDAASTWEKFWVNPY